MIDAYYIKLVLFAASIILILFWFFAIRLIFRSSNYKLKLIIHGVIVAGYILFLLQILERPYGLVGYYIMVVIFAVSHAIYIIILTLLERRYSGMKSKRSLLLHPLIALGFVAVYFIIFQLPGIAVNKVINGIHTGNINQVKLYAPFMIGKTISSSKFSYFINQTLKNNDVEILKWMVTHRRKLFRGTIPEEIFVHQAKDEDAVKIRLLMFLKKIKSEEEDKLLLKHIFFEEYAQANELIKQGVSVNARDLSGVTPMTIAMARYKPDLMISLVSRGAKNVLPKYKTISYFSMAYAFQMAEEKKDVNVTNILHQYTHTPDNENLKSWLTQHHPAIAKGSSTNLDIKTNQNKSNKTAVMSLSELIQKNRIEKTGENEYLAKDAIGLETLLSYANENMVISLLPKDYAFKRCLEIKNTEGLVLKGADKKKTRIVNSEAYESVICIRTSQNILIKNITFGHHPDPGYCLGGVLEVDKSLGIKVDNTILFGCGVEGVLLYETQSFELINSEIRACSENTMKIVSSDNVNILKTNIYNNAGGIDVFASKVRIEESQLDEVAARITFLDPEKNPMNFLSNRRYPLPKDRYDNQVLLSKCDLKVEIGDDYFELAVNGEPIMDFGLNLLTNKQEYLKVENSKIHIKIQTMIHDGDEEPEGEKIKSIPFSSTNTITQEKIPLPPEHIY